MNLLPAEQPPEPIAAYLQAPDALRRDAAWCRLAPAHIAAIETAAAELLHRPDRLADLARCASSLLGPEAWNGAAWQDTPRDTSVGERFFLILPLLQRVRGIRAWYAARSIPETVLRDTLSDLTIWIETNRERTGLPGFREIGWLREHVSGRVIRLGRLQFQPAVFGHRLVVLRHRRSRAVCLVAGAGRGITPRGIFADSEGATGPVTELVCEEEGGEIRRGHVVQADGRIAPAPTAFAAGDWQRELSPGDAVLALHIPAGAPLDPLACLDSFRQAETFYPRYFGERPAARAVTCSSWLLYPELSELLPPGANIVRFQRAFHRFPVEGATSRQTYERAFPSGVLPPDRGALKSTLQQRLFDHIRQGHVPISGGGLVLPPFSRAAFDE
jgi:hypothetical protein